MPEENSTENPLILIDGSSYLYRAYHALPPLMSSKNQPTGAIRGVISMINKILLDHPNSPLAVIFDAKGKTFRHEMYKDYKANRPPMPEDLVQQIEPINQIIEALGIKLLSIKGVEADDVIGTLAKEASEVGLNTVISTGDKDMTQLVNKHIRVVNTMSNELLDEKGVEDKFGVKPKLIVDYLALVGDSSDNVPGVEKVGPKTAVKWLIEYGSLDEIIKNAEKISGKVGENLRNGMSQLHISKELVTIKKDVSLEVGVKDLTVGKRNKKLLDEIYTELEFKAWLEKEEVPAKEVKEEVIKQSKYECIIKLKQLESWLTKIKNSSLLALDTETTGLDYMDAKLVGISLSVKSGEAAYIPLGHQQEEQLDVDVVLKKLKPILESTKIKIVGQNIKFDRNILARYGIQLTSFENDTMLMSYVLNSTATRHNLDALAQYYLNYKTTTFEEVAGKGVKQVTFDLVPIDQAVHYASEDADITYRLHEELKSRLAKEPVLNTLLEEIEIPLITVLSDMERAGTLVNEKVLKAQSKNFSKRITKLETEAYELADQEFNLGSPKQLQEIFFEKLKYPILQKTPGGQPSTAENVLQQLSEDYELPKIILEHRTLSKLKSTYTDKLPSQISPSTGRIHTSFNQTGTSTGRLSSSDPNLQNIPIKTEDGRRIRQAFEAPKGYQLISADYSQIELRVIAHLSKDEGLLKAFKEGQDIHSSTASEVFGVDIKEVDLNQRRSAKAINFGLIYGISAFGLSKQLGINRNLAAEYMDIYFSRYPGVRKYMNTIKSETKKIGYVETLYGRRLYLPEISTGNAIRRQAAERVAINAPVQGTAADIMKKAMLSVNDSLKEQKIDAKLILQVHDELVVESHEKDTSKVKKILTDSMSKAAKLSVPLEVEIGIGKNWDQAH
ncbi:MAG: DNA polymerase I [SAR86 cluster bacterium]|nr:DNA polymerase I [SAR86 cluster bacterium]